MSAKEARCADLEIPEECLPQLRRLAAMVVRWNPTVNLVSRASVPDVWQRHVLDSAQLLRLAPQDAAHWADLGSGGGFPGLVVAIVGRVTHPDTRFTLVESDRRKAAFLSEAARETGVAPEILAERVEHVPPLAADVISARALAPLETLLPHVVRHIGQGGLALLPKGASHTEECRRARASGWRFDLGVERSVTDPTGAILVLRDICHD